MDCLVLSAIIEEFCTKLAWILGFYFVTNESILASLGTSGSAEQEWYLRSACLLLDLRNLGVYLRGVLPSFHCRLQNKWKVKCVLRGHSRKKEEQGLRRDSVESKQYSAHLQLHVQEGRRGEERS